MSEEDIKTDRYNKFRKLGDYREYLVEGGNWEAADKRRSNASGVTTKTGRWAEVRSPVRPTCSNCFQRQCQARSCIRMLARIL
jgi:hypothetical protein